VTVTLAIDTASDRFALALLGAAGVARRFESPTPRDHTRGLLPAIESILAGEELVALAVVIGPGSYAGLRVGIATAQGLALARGIPLAGVGTLEAVAAAVGGSARAIHPIGRGEFALQAFVGGAALAPAVAVAAAELGGGEAGEAPRAHAAREGRAGTEAPGVAHPRGELLAGEGAGAMGGIEVGPLARCIAAAGLAAGRRADPGALEAVYPREPTISLPRKATVAAGVGKWNEL
jgi:tRNA threonylcarbamoyl adenosine modification protein YeaZ